jgi:K+-transporting ATPase KdpF subunit
LLGLCEGLRPALERDLIAMDYIVGGITATFLFAYLLYGLLKPEKF